LRDRVVISIKLTRRVILGSRALEKGRRKRGEKKRKKKRKRKEEEERKNVQLYRGAQST